MLLAYLQILFFFFSVAEDLDRPRVHKRIPKCDFVSAVGPDGQRVYMKLWNEEVLEAEVSCVVLCSVSC